MSSSNPPSNSSNISDQASAAASAAAGGTISIVNIDDTHFEYQFSRPRNRNNNAAGFGDGAAVSSGATVSSGVAVSFTGEQSLMAPPPAADSDPSISNNDDDNGRNNNNNNNNKNSNAADKGSVKNSQQRQHQHRQNVYNERREELNTTFGLIPSSYRVTKKKLSEHSSIVRELYEPPIQPQPPVLTSGCRKQIKGGKKKWREKSIFFFLPYIFLILFSLSINQYLRRKTWLDSRQCPLHIALWLVDRPYLCLLRNIYGNHHHRKEIFKIMFQLGILLFLAIWKIH